MSSLNKIKFFLFKLVIISLLLTKNNSNLKITFSFYYPIKQYLYCDDEIDAFRNNKITVYKVNGGQIVIAGMVFNLPNQGYITKELSIETGNKCQNLVSILNSIGTEEYILEFLDFPHSFHNLFLESTINSFKILEIRDITVPMNYDYSSMFEDCIELSSIDLSEFDIFYKATKLNNMFFGCKKLKYVNWPNYLKTNNIYFNSADFSNMFFDCSSLTSIDFSFFNLNISNYMENIFYNCINLKSIKMKGNLNETELVYINNRGQCKNTSEQFQSCNEKI